MCIKELRLVTMQLPEKFLAYRTGTRPNFAFTEFYEVRCFLAICRVLCPGAHTLPSHRSMLPSLRGQLTPREGAGQLPVLLLETWARYLQTTKKPE